MIHGVGTDIIEVKRVESVLARHGDHFARRILAADEWEQFMACAIPARFLAKRFAAKEAFAKAVGTGLRGLVTWHNISIGHDRLGKPAFVFQLALEKQLREAGISAHHLSISDEKELAVAFVVLEKSKG